jgi:hypothetical protein
VQPSPAGENSAVALQGPGNAAPSPAQLEYRRRNATPEAAMRCARTTARPRRSISSTTPPISTGASAARYVLWAADGAMDRLTTCWRSGASVRNVTGKGMPGGHNMQEGAPEEVSRVARVPAWVRRLKEGRLDRLRPKQ